MFWLLLTLFPADDPKTTTLRYLKPQGERFVLESEITRREMKDGSVFTSRTVRGKLSLTLTVHRDRNENVRDADIVTDLNGVKKTARVEWRAEMFHLTRDEKTVEIKAPHDAVVTSAPDWSDIIELIRRYDDKKKGKQSFGGLWFHPIQAPLTPMFTVEPTGTDTIKVKGKEEGLRRFEIRLRASMNRVWARADGVVVKILPAGQQSNPIVLEGYEEATGGLK